MDDVVEKRSRETSLALVGLSAGRCIRHVKLGSGRGWESSPNKHVMPEVARYTIGYDHRQILNDRDTKRLTCSCHRLDSSSAISIYTFLRYKYDDHVHCTLTACRIDSDALIDAASWIAVD